MTKVSSTSVSAAPQARSCAATAYNPNLLKEANTALSLQIFGNATSSFVAAQDRAWGAALTLVLLTFVLTLVARIITARFARRR